MSTETNHPRIGVACFVWKDGKFLMAKRKGSHGSDKWSVPGGHLEYGETWAEAAKREVKEETGMEVKNLRFKAVTNDIMSSDNKHYISIWIESDWDSGEPSIIEPDKCTEIGWYDFSNLPEPLFEPCWQNLRASNPELFQ